MTETLHEDRVRFGHGMIEASKPFATQQDQNKTIFALDRALGARPSRSFEFLAHPQV